MHLLLSADFFQNKLFMNIIRVSNGLDPDQDHGSVNLDLIWVQTVCKGYQQMTKFAASLPIERVCTAAFEISGILILVIL